MTATLAKWFDLYSENHRDKANKKVHFICVPLIFFSLLGLLSLIRFSTGGKSAAPVEIRMDYVFLAFALAFYLCHSFQIFAGIALFTFGCLALINAIAAQDLFPPWAIFVTIFVLAWIGQFLGHKHEGKKPAFLTDLVFLLIGPAWIIRYIYQRLGIRF